jgi:hypothetical protein
MYRLHHATEDSYQIFNAAFNAQKSVKKKAESPQGFLVVKQNDIV